MDLDALSALNFELDEPAVEQVVEPVAEQIVEPTVVQTLDALSAFDTVTIDEPVDDEFADDFETEEEVGKHEDDTAEVYNKVDSESGSNLSKLSSF